MRRSFPISGCDNHLKVPTVPSASHFFDVLPWHSAEFWSCSWHRNPAAATTGMPNGATSTKQLVVLFDIMASAAGLEQLRFLAYVLWFKSWMWPWMKSKLGCNHWDKNPKMFLHLHLKLILQLIILLLLLKENSKTTWSRRFPRDQ